MPGRGGTTAGACRRIAAGERTYCRWRKGAGRPGGGPGATDEGPREGHARRRRATFRPRARQAHPAGGGEGKLPGPARRRRCVAQVRGVPDVSGRRVRGVLGQHRSTRRKVPCEADDEGAPTEDTVALAKRHGRRRVTALLPAAGGSVDHERVERVWRRAGVKVPQRQPKRGRLWLNDGPCIRRRPKHASGLVAGSKRKRTTDAGSASSPASTRPAENVWRWSSRVGAGTKAYGPPLQGRPSRGPPAHIGSDNGGGSIATAAQKGRGPGRWADRREDAPHHAGLAMAERLQREPRRRHLLQPHRGLGAGGRGADRGSAAPPSGRTAASAAARRRRKRRHRPCRPPVPLRSPFRPARAAEATMHQPSARTTRWGLLRTTPTHAEHFP